MEQNFFIDARTGSDTNTGLTWATAFRTIERAWNRARAVSTTTSRRFIIGAGQYTIIGIMDRLEMTSVIVRAIQFIGVGGVSIKVDHPRGRIPIDLGWCAQIQGIHFEGTCFNIFHTANIGWTGKAIIFSNCGLPFGLLNSSVISAESPFTIGIRACNHEGVIPARSSTLITANADLFTVEGGGRHRVTLYRMESVANCLKTAGGFWNRPLISPEPLNFGAIGAMPQHFQANSAGTSFLPTIDLATETHMIGRGIRFPSTSASRLEHTEAQISNWTRFMRFSDWIVDPTTPGSLSIVDNASISLTIGDNVAALSPVFLFPSNLSIQRIMLHATEFVGETSAQVLDSTPESPIRTIDLRWSHSPFTQTQTDPAWVRVERGVNLKGIVVKYLQYKITFALGAAV